ncbi:hypothetical protein PV11_08352 [Exophiala sideris]|uniref:Uncharacterized protein n=1 Tax=Exophiala sideris TaxID=1016849 RepID=A0A0D1VX66_9EURO|nr:hypothetical protein PV11_08352 [Exophiala sideris]
MYKIWKASQDLAIKYQVFAGSGSVLVAWGALTGIIWYKERSSQETINKHGVLSDNQGKKLNNMETSLADVERVTENRAAIK